MSKICTTIEQSKKLIELGLDANTADMYYPYLGSEEYGDTPRVGKGMVYSGKEDIPSWSLSALLNLLPHTDLDGVELNNYSDDRKVWTALFYWKNIRTQIKIADNPFDAVFKVVCWFLENKEIMKRIR